MKRNGMCPVCFFRQLFTSKPSHVRPALDEYVNSAAALPPMGWSSWNTFKNRIDQNLIYETAVAMKESGLADAGYNYINLDDCWQSSLRDGNDELVGDYETFPDGIAALSKKVNALGLKLGAYTSNGTLTCEDLPASLGREKRDAYTLAKWGVEYFKYDFCHNVIIPCYAPLVYSVSVSAFDGKAKEYSVQNGTLGGYARYMTDKKMPNGCYVSGLDKNLGSITFENIEVDSDGEYVFTVNVKKKGRYEKFLIVEVNGRDPYEISFPEQKHYNDTARFQTIVHFKKGKNSVKLYNPVACKADSEMYQYRRMGDALKSAAEKIAAENKEAVKPITFSVCEWGFGKPWIWGKYAGNLWRTTPDIRPVWSWINVIYERNVKLYKYASVGHWNDPDMLEVGNGRLSYDENVAHFTLWCFMNAPLILGNDLRNMSANVKEIVTKKSLIEVNQDALGKQAKRIRRGLTDVLAKPLADGGVAVCFFNKSAAKVKSSLQLKKLADEKYLGLNAKNSYTAENLWTGEKQRTDGKLSVTLNGHSVQAFKIYADK